MENILNPPHQVSILRVRVWSAAKMHVQPVSVCSVPYYYVQTERTSRVFEGRVLRKIFEPKTEEVTGGWGKMHKELHNC
jgi:hypothetical protein